MSAEPIVLHRAPSAVRVAPGGASECVGRLVERRERAAFESGCRAGRAAALANGVQTLDQAAAAFAATSAQQNAALAGDGVELAIAIATELVRCEVGARRHDIEALVRDTLTVSGAGRGACTVHVSPADAEALGAASFRAATKIEPDPDVPAGCVQVETAQGLLVRDLDAALASIATRLREGARP